MLKRLLFPFFEKGRNENFFSCNIIDGNIMIFGSDSFYNRSLTVPNGIKTLIFTDNFNDEITFHSLKFSSSLETIYFGKSFNTKIKRTFFFKNIKHIIFGDSFNQQFNCFLPIIESVEFGRDYNQPVEFVNRKGTLKKIILKENFNSFFKEKYTGVNVHIFLKSNLLSTGEKKMRFFSLKREKNETVVSVKYGTDNLEGCNIIFHNRSSMDNNNNDNVKGAIRINYTPKNTFYHENIKIFFPSEDVPTPSSFSCVGDADATAINDCSSDKNYHCAVCFKKNEKTPLFLFFYPYYCKKCKTIYYLVCKDCVSSITKCLYCNFEDIKK